MQTRDDRDGRRVTCPRVVSDESGESHFAEVAVSLNPTDYAPPAPPLDVSAPWEAQRAVLVGAAPGWEGNWHPSPRRQLVVCLSGRFEVGVSDGQTLSFGPGDSVLLEDTDGKGHRTRVTSSVYALTAMVHLGPP